MKKHSPLLGKKHSAEHNRKIAEAMLGNTNSLGVKRSKATNKRHSLALKGRKHSPSTLRKMSIAHKGKKMSAATRLNMSKAQLKRWRASRAVSVETP